MAAQKIRVLIVDDMPETRENLRRLLDLETDVAVVGVVADGEEGIRMTLELQPEIVLMDINMPGVDGITATERISLQAPASQVIMMSVQGEAAYLRRSMLAGAREFLIKPFSSDELVSSIRRVSGLTPTKSAELLPIIESLTDLNKYERWAVYKNNRTHGRALDELELIVSAISHDLKEPMVMARNLLSDLDASNSLIEQADLVYCKNKLDYGLLLVDRLIATTSGTVFKVTEKTSLNDTLEFALSLVRTNLQSYGRISARKALGNPVAQIKEADLRQIIVCLLENATEAVAENGTIHAIVKGGNPCSIIIFNSGSLAEEPAIISELGYTTWPNHAGVGLFVVKNLVARYGGKLAITAENDLTIRVEVSLPKAFKSQKRKFALHEVDASLAKFRNLPATPAEHVAVQNLVDRILKAFVIRLASILKDTHSVTSLAIEKPQADTPRDQLSALYQFQRNCTYAQAIVESMTEPSRPIDVHAINLRVAMVEVLNLFETKLEKKSVQLDIGGDLWVKADRTLFQRVFFNLIRNALEAMRQQGEFSLKIAAHVKNDFVVIRLSDKGKGISKDIISKIFDRGFSTKGKGGGLGLFVVRTIVDQHHGRIEVQSEQNVGTTFSIYWPIAPKPTRAIVPLPAEQGRSVRKLVAEQQPENSITAGIAVDDRDQHLPQLLIVEDNADWRGFFARRLQSSQYTIQFASNPGEALDLIKTSQYGLILLDWKMSGIGGKGVLEVARKNNLNTPIVILSAFGHYDQRSLAKKLGARDFIDKPQTRRGWEDLKRLVLDVLREASL